MAARDESDREIAAYLRFLLNHGSQCHVSECPLCSTLQSICDYAAARFFSVEQYPRVEAAHGRLAPAGRH